MLSCLEGVLQYASCSRCWHAHFLEHFCFVFFSVPRFRVFHYGSDLTSWSSGPDDAFDLAIALLVLGALVQSLLLARFRVTYA